MGRARREGLRADDRPPRGAARRARVVGAALDADGRPAGRGARRHGQDAVPHARRTSRRGGADALPRRPPLDLRLVAVRVPADLHVLRDGRDAVPPQPDGLGDRRPGAALPPLRDHRPLRVHGDGRADAEPRPRPRRGAPAARPRDHAPAYDDLDDRLAARPAALRGRGRGADPARALAARRRPGAPLDDHAGERPLPASPTSSPSASATSACGGARCSSST